MKITRAITSAALTLGLAVATGAVAGPATAAAHPDHDQCPSGRSGYELWDVDAEPYTVDNEVDEKGNGDGLVCARPMKSFFVDDGTTYQVYNFFDNRVAAPG